MNPKIFRALKGGEAAARSAYAVCGAFIVLEKAGAGTDAVVLGREWSSRALKNLAQDVPRTLALTPDVSSGDRLLDILRKRPSGSLPAAVFARADEAAALLPALRKAREEGLDLVLHLACETDSDLAPFFPLHLPVLGSGSAQEACDFAAIASLLARRTKAPVLHAYDRRRVEGEFAKIDVAFLEGGALAPHLLGKPDPADRSAAAVLDDVFERFKELSGRPYRPYEFLGSREADRVCVAWGAEAKDLEETVPAAEGTGLVLCRLLRPMDARSFLAAFPPTTRKIFSTELLNADVLSALHDGIVGGWSWFVNLPPVSAIPADLARRDAPDDVFETTVRGRRKEAASAICDLFEDLAGRMTSSFQVYAPDEGDAVHVRIAPETVKRRGPSDRADLLVILRPGILGEDEVLHEIREGGVLVVNAPERTPFVPPRVAEIARARKIRLLAVDLSEISRCAGLSGSFGPALQSCLLRLWGATEAFGLTAEKALEIVREGVEDRWSDFSEDIVAAHRRALEEGQASLREIGPDDRMSGVTATPSPSALERAIAKGSVGSPDIRTSYLGFSLRSPFVVCVSEEADDDARRDLSDSPVGAVFFGPVAEEELDREAWRTFAILHEGVRPPGFKAQPPLEAHLDRLKRWKDAVEAPVIAGLAAVSEKNWLALAFALEQAGADAVELFLRAPDEGGPEDPFRIVSLVGAALKIPVAVRVTPSLANLAGNSDALAAAGARGLVFFQQPTGPIRNPENLEPRDEILLGGPAVFRLALPILARTYEAVSIDTAAAGPSSDPRDVISALLSGARAAYVAPGAAGLHHLAEALRGWMSDKGFADLNAVRGRHDRGEKMRSVVE